MLSGIKLWQALLDLEDRLQFSYHGGCGIVDRTPRYAETIRHDAEMAAASPVGEQQRLDAEVPKSTRPMPLRHPIRPPDLIRK